MQTKLSDWGDFRGMSEEDQLKKLRVKFNEYMLNNEDAVRFLESIYFVSHVWDDLIDRDKDVDNSLINKCFFIAFFELNKNPFYRKHQDYLVDIMNVFINQWLDSNELEKGDENAQIQAYVLRDTMLGLICHCAYLIGGFEHMRNVSHDLSKMTKKYQTFDEYKKEKNNA